MEFKKLDVKKVEKELETVISKLKIGDKISVEWVKDFTYNFDLPTNQVSKKYFGRLMDLLPRNINESDMIEAMQVFNDAWNCLPQKIMKGKSPQDRFFDEVKKENNKKPKHLTEQEKIVEAHYKYAEEHLDEYLDWTLKEVLPKYDKYLKNNKIIKLNERVGVAGAFLEICGQFGFFEVSNLPPNFIEDFPEIFMDSVMGHKLKKKDIAEYLKDFLSFLSIYYPKIDNNNHYTF